MMIQDLYIFVTVKKQTKKNCISLKKNVMSSQERSCTTFETSRQEKEIKANEVWREF